MMTTSIMMFFLLIIYLVDYIQCACDVRCQTCSQDGICTQCMTGYVYNTSLSTCQSTCLYNTYRDDTTGKCASICPESYYNDNTLLSCVKYPNCPNLVEKGQNHFDLIRAAGVTSQLLFLAGDQNNVAATSATLKVYSRANTELQGILTEHSNNVLGIRTNTINNQDELMTYSSSELILWDITLGQMIRKGSFDQNLEATSFSYIDQDMIILQQDVQTFGILLLSQFRNTSSSFSSIIFQNKQINQLKGFARYQNNIYSFSQDGKLFQYNINTQVKKQLCQLNNTITNLVVFSETSMVISFGYNILAYYNGQICINQDLGHTNVINKILYDVDPKKGYQYVFTFDSSEFIYSYVNANNQLQMLSYRNIKQSYSKIMQNYLITIDSYGQIILYTYSNMILNEALTLNLSFSQYFAISDVYLGLSSQQMYIFGSELLTLNIDISKQANQVLSLASRTKNIPSSMIKHTQQVNGVLFDRWLGRVITYSDDGSIIFYDQIGDNQFQFVMQRYYPSTDCDMLANTRCFKKVSYLQSITTNIYAAIYSDASVILWKYSPLSLDMIKQLTLTDRSTPILNIYISGNILIYCNAKEIRAYDYVLDSVLLVYAPADAPTYNFLHCATDSYNSANYLIFSKILNASYFIIATDTFTNLSQYKAIPSTQQYSVYRDIYVAVYYPSLKWYMVTNSQLQLIFANFTTFNISPMVVSQNLPVSVAFDPNTRDFTCFSKNQFVSFFLWNPTTKAYVKQNTYQFAAVVTGQQQSTAISTPELYFYFQNTGVSTIQNQVLVIRPNLNFQLVLTFSDKISSLNVDTNTKKLFIGFSSGLIYSGYYIENYVLFQQNTDYNAFYYSDNSDLLFAYKKSISVIDTTLLQQNATLSDSAMVSDMIGVTFIEQTKELIAYNSDTSKNLVKWNIYQGTNQQFINGHITAGVVNVQLDTSVNLMISQGADFLIIIWNYATVTEVYRILDHQTAKANLDLSQANLLPSYRTNYNITMFSVDTVNQVIVSANNIGNIFVHSYTLQTAQNVTLVSATYVYVDNLYNQIIAASNYNFINKLTIYSYSKTTLTFVKDVGNIHIDTILGVLIQNSNVYSYEETKIAVMDRATLSLKISIVCQNPLITNFIVYEKLMQVIIWSDSQTSTLNQSIGIYSLATGLKIQDVNYSQVIEQGNIHKVLVDEDTNQMFVAKTYNTGNYIYAIDLSTFYYSGYYTSTYTSYLKQWQYIKRVNRLIYIDYASPSNLLIYNMEACINQMNNFKVISDVKNKNTLLSSDSSNMYYFDGLNQSWKQTLATDKLVFLNSFNQVKSSKQIGNYFYLVTSTMAIKYTSNLLQLNSFTMTSYQVFFTNYYLYLTDFNNSILQLELSSFNQLAFSRTLESAIQQFIPYELYQEAIVVLTTLKIYRFNMLTGDTIATFTTFTTLSMILVDNVNPIIIHVTTPYTLSFYSYTQAIANYTSILLQTVVNGFTISKVKFDLTNKALLVLSNTDRIPIIRVYQYVFSSNTLQSPLLLANIPSPSRSSSQYLNIQDSNTIAIILSWQIINYNRKTYLFSNYFRDTQVIYSRLNLSQVTGFPNLLNSIQTDSNQLFSLANNTFAQPSLYKLPLSYPVILNYNLTQSTIYYQINMNGISSSFLFDYTFQIPIPQTTSTSGFNSCYFYINGTYKYNVEMAMRTFQNSINKLKFNLSNSLIQVNAQNGFFYDQLMSTYGASVIYQNNNATQPVITVTQSLFTAIGQDQVIINNYILDISNGGNITLNSNANRLIFKSITLIGNPSNFTFNFANLQSVILEDVSITNMSLTGSSILFSITSCNSVYIKNMTIQSLQLGPTAQLLYVKDITSTFAIEGMNINQLTINSVQQQQYVITMINIMTAIFTNSNFTQIIAVQSQSPFYFLSSQGIQSLTFQSVQYQQTFGCSFLQSKNFYFENQQIVYLLNDYLIFTNCNFTSHFNLPSPFISIQNNYAVLNTLNFYNIECPTCQGTVISNVQVLTSFTASNCNFYHTIGQQGGAVAFLDNQNSTLLIEDSTFYNCTASASGGALFISNSDLVLNRTSINKCIAQIGGGIRYIGLEPAFIQLSSSTQRILNTYPVTNNITLNTAAIYGQNIGSYPKMIKIIASVNMNKESYSSSDNPDEYNLDLYKLQNFQSGASINFQFQILDQEGNPIYFDPSQMTTNYYPSIILTEIEQFSIKALPGNDNIKVFGQYITDYTQFDKSTQTFSIKQMLIIAQPESENFIQFETPCIQKVINSNTDRYFNSGPFYITLDIEFRKCIRGEVYKLSGSIFYCQECLEGSYSIVQPIRDEYDSQLCLRCPDDASYCYRDQMELKQGYWKNGNDTDQIVYCSNQPDNCDGTQDTNYCIEGHIGPQCETCDNYGLLWKNEYQSDGKFGCINCTQLRDPQNIFPMIFIAVGMVAYILISIKIASDISKLIVLGYYLRQLNVLSINKSAYQDTTNMNMKAMVNYMQISSMINTFVVQLPEFMTFVPKYFGSPIENMLYTFDCFLSKASEQKFPIVFLRTLWSLCIPFFYLLGVGLIYLILVKLKYAHYNRSYIISGLVFLSFFTQPNMVSNLLGVMSCRDIDGKLYISSDIAYECYTKIHLTYIAVICLPGLVLWGAFIPSYILKLLMQNKDKLDHASIRLKYGFLYQDFKKNLYYWEFIKMYVKLSAVAILNFYGNPYTNKLVIILVVFLLYLVALLRFKPYQMQQFQKLDRNSMIVAITLLLMNIFLFNKPDTVQQELFYVILLMIHNGYQLYLIWQVCIAKISVMFRAKYNRFKRWLIKTVPFLKKYIIIDEGTSMKTFHLWLKIKYYLNEYVERKQYNEINRGGGKLRGSMSNSKENLENRSFQPSKRNRQRLQNHNQLQVVNSQLQNSARLGDHILAMSDDNSQRHLNNKDQIVSIDKLDQLISPKLSSNNLLFISPRREESSRNYGNLLEIDDLLLTPHRNQIIQTPLLLSSGRDILDISNYGEIEEMEDERRLQKKTGINYDYRTYQKTDMIKKNLKPAFIVVSINNQGIDEVEEQSFDSENSNIHDSMHQRPDNQNNEVKVDRNTNTLAPRVQLSKLTNLDELTPNKRDLSQLEIQIEKPKKVTELIELNDEDNSDDEDIKALNEQEEEEEEQDQRRISTKHLINHNLNLQKKSNLIYKNLFKIECTPPGELQTRSNEDNVENILETEEDSQKPSALIVLEKGISSADGDIKLLQKQPSSMQFESQNQLPSQQIFSNTVSFDPEGVVSNQEFELLQKK